MKDKIRYFYLNGHLHRVMKSYRATGMVQCFDYAEGKYVGLLWADARKYMQTAFSLKQAEKVFGVSSLTLWKYIYEGHVKKPQHTYSPEKRERNIVGKYYFSEDDMMDVHEYMLTRWKGGEIDEAGLRRVAPNTPSRAEILARMRHGEVLYTKIDDDTYVPVWRSPEW